MTSSGGISATYNGDGVRVQRGATQYTQDLAAALSQVLTDGSANYVYGHERLVTQQGATRTWYATDALGSVRATLDGAGAVQGTVGYDPWGTPQGDLLGTFGFTGELQDGDTSLLYLRARWYDPGQSTFTSRDPFAGFPETPYSLHPYQYGYSNPVLWTDPSGRCPAPPRGSGDVICVALFIATPHLGPEISLVMTLPPLVGGGRTVAITLPLGVGDGRGFSANSSPLDTFPLHGGSRASIYLFMDDCGKLLNHQAEFNRSYVLGGIFGLGFGPYLAYERFEAKQAHHDIAVTWRLFNGASAWARRHADTYRHLAEAAQHFPKVSPDTTVPPEVGYRLGAALFQALEWMIALDPIDGALTIAVAKATDTYRIKTMNRDPYPSLEA